MRRRLAWLAVRLPPLHVTERLGPITTLTLALAAGFWTLFQYSDQLAINRVKTGFEMHRLYLEAFPGGAAERLPGMYDRESLLRRIEIATCAELVAQGLVPRPSGGCAKAGAEDQERFSAALGALTAPQRKRMRDALEAAQAQEDTSAEEDRGRSSLLGFYRAVSICIDGGACDPSTTLGLFRAEIIPFLNATCGKLALDSIETADALAIAATIHRVDGIAAPYWSDKSQRSQQFLCNWLRALDPGNPPQSDG